MRLKPGSKWKRRFIPCLERLEDRTVPATVNVSNIQQLQAAILAANNFDTIVMQNGVYQPAGALTGNFIDLNTTLAHATTLTIKAANPGQAIIDGSATTNPVEMIDFNGNPGSQIQFQGVNFQNAGNANPALGGAATIINANVTFTDCTFQNNVNLSQGGAALITGSSFVHFNSCTFNHNESEINGGALFVQSSGGSVPTVVIDNSIFMANDTTNLPGVLPETQGGAIEASVADLTINNTTFDNNESNNSGGAIGIIGNEQYNPLAVMNVSNCTFNGNSVVQNPQNSTPTNVNGGAIAMDTGATAVIVLSRFIDNTAPRGGGAIITYRDSLTVDQCYFQGNSSAGSLGGTISVASQSAPNSFGLPKGSLKITNSFIEGNTDPNSNTVTAVAGGGIYVNGDRNSFLGQGGVPQNGTLQSNQGQLTVNNVVFANLVVQNSQGGNGGAIEGDLANVNITDALFLNCKALQGSGGFVAATGGGLAALTGSTVSVSNSTFSNCTADFAGGAIFATGSSLTVNTVNFVQNTATFLPPGNPLVPNASLDGSAIYTAGDNSFGFASNATGVVQNSTFSLNNGVPIFETDANSPPQNNMVYGGNQFWAPISSNFVFADSLGHLVNVSGLNTLVVHGVAKSPSQNNSQLPSMPVIAQLWAAPNRVYTISANGDAVQGSINELAWVVSGASSGTIRPPTGSSFPAGSPNGFQQVETPGNYTLTVAGASPATATMIKPTLLVASADAPGGAYIPVFDAETGAHVQTILWTDPYFSGGARVAMADINGDGVPDFIVTAGPGGGAFVEVFDGVTGKLLPGHQGTFLAIPQDANGNIFTGGLYVAAGDVTGAGTADIILGADAGGGPAVSVFDSNANMIGLFFALPIQFTGGVRVATARLAPNGPASIVTGVGYGGAPFVTIFNYTGNPSQPFVQKANGTFAVLPQTFLGGIYVGGGDLQNTGHDLIISGAGQGGGPFVSVYDPNTDAQVGPLFPAFNDVNFTGGIRVSGARGLILVGAGPNDPSTLGPNAVTFDGASEAAIDRFFAFDPTFTGGIFVASS